MQYDLKPIGYKPKNRKLKEIHQIVQALAYGDAISSHAMAIKDFLRSIGYKSDIYVRYLDTRLVHEAKVFKNSSISQDAGILYHHSLGTRLSEFVLKHKGPKCLIYHNITPEKFFVPYQPGFAKILKKGRDDLNRFASYFPLSAGDSAFNASELEAAGFHQPHVLSIMVSPKKWVHDLNDILITNLQDGRRNIVFVGKIAPHKCQHDLVKAFYEYQKMDAFSRLIIVGKIQDDDPYYEFLIDTIRKYRLNDQVIVTGSVSESDLQAYYHTAHIFWSMSEHEGFCVPLIEAMWFNVPVLAYKSTAVPETLDKAGMMFTSKNDLSMIAALAKIVVHDIPLRSKILDAQEKRRVQFLPEMIHPKLVEILDQMESIKR